MLDDARLHPVPDTPKILLTGATGFVGRSVFNALVDGKYPVVSVTRKRRVPPVPGVHE
jgi:uncharacterized protein YbjT (DUF2867 family)